MKQLVNQKKSFNHRQTSKISSEIWQLFVSGEELLKLIADDFNQDTMNFLERHLEETNLSLLLCWLRAAFRLRLENTQSNNRLCTTGDDKHFSNILMQRCCNEKISYIFRWQNR